MAYKSKFNPKNTQKYQGNPTNIIARSLWERAVFHWCDTSSSVELWSSEEIIVSYRCMSDGKIHRYYPDLKIKFANGDVYLIEIKPKKQTEEPKKKSRITRSYLFEVMTYAKNVSKWSAAKKFCEARNWTFKVWTEDTLRQLGILIAKR